ncbi:MAG: hypothetical protein NTX53_08785 [candidate division WOR-3 bacterium]|nr:hypothetical protein [candidate division WOR-3 bacterium]
MDRNGRPIERPDAAPARPFGNDSDTIFILKDTMDLPSEFVADPGQFSRDGLQYYIGLLPRDDVESLYVMGRAQLEVPFGIPRLVAGSVNENPDSLPYTCQPSVTADGRTLVFVRSDWSWDGNDLYLATRPDTSAPFDSVRALSEINVSGDADAYPWISPDGLRLYYTRGSSLAVASRESVQSPFGAPEPFPIRSGGGFFSAWLTDDELETYFVGDGIDYAWRLSPGDSFSVPVQHPEFSELGFVSGPSRFGREFYLFNSSSDTDLVLIFMPARSGLQAGDPMTTRGQAVPPTLLRGVLELPGDRRPGTGDRAALLDIAGRAVLNLRPGPNDVSALAPGVYFVRNEGRGAGDVGRTRKVVLQR